MPLNIMQTDLGTKLMHDTPEALKVKYPILYLEGDTHKKHKRNIEKFWTEAYLAI